MKRYLLIFMCLVSGALVMPAGAVVTGVVKKAAPVATTQKNVGADAAASLLPTVMNLVGGIQQLNAQTKALSAECVPTAKEITFVDNMMKEWAKTGAAAPSDMARLLGRRACSTNETYASSVIALAGTDVGDICFDVMTSTNVGEIWVGYPKVGKVDYCSDGTLSCKNKQTKSDIYDIFSLIDFGAADYLPAEATQAAALMDKIEKCSTAKLTAKQRALKADFLKSTMAGLGQETDTSSVMEMVGGLTGGGGLSTLGTGLLQMLDK